jgi:hypothetical protein
MGIVCEKMRSDSCRNVYNSGIADHVQRRHDNE